MIYGLDTGFLVAVEVGNHPDHIPADTTLAQIRAAGDVFAIAPQVLSEFMHVVTDGRRFPQPLSVPEARRLAEKWWTAKEVVQVFPDAAATALFFTWHKQFALGRKRVLDTLLAATYHQASIASVLTTNPGDFAVFGVFNCILPGFQPGTP